MKPHRNRVPIRLPGYDYSQPGAYFITICTKERVCSLATKIGHKMELSKVGEIVEEYWLRIPGHFEAMRLDVYTIMPNHVHGIIQIVPQQGFVGVQNFEPLRHEFRKVIPDSISSAIRSFKAAVRVWCTRNGASHFRWQRNFYDHVIRTEAELQRIRQYTLRNPAIWDQDIENPASRVSDSDREGYYERIYWGPP